MRVSLGEGLFRAGDLGAFGSGSVAEPGLRVFGAAFIRIGAEVYLGHDSFLRAYPQGPLEIRDGCWLGPRCFINSYGGVSIGERVGLGPGVCILTSAHDLQATGPILDRPLNAAPVVIGAGADLGAGAVLLPGVRIGECAQVGAGAVVSRDVPAGGVVAGVPARGIP